MTCLRIHPHAFKHFLAGRGGIVEQGSYTSVTIHPHPTPVGRTLIASKMWGLGDYLFFNIWSKTQAAKISKNFIIQGFFTLHTKKIFQGKTFSGINKSGLGTLKGFSLDCKSHNRTLKRSPCLAKKKDGQ